MTENEKIVIILKILTGHSKDRAQGCFDSDKLRELIEKFYDISLELDEVEYLCRILIENNDVIDASSFDGVSIGYKGSTSDALYSGKYNDQKF